uniref:Uncharacterized protein n=1 Tax=Chrysotila carterae TaxID=13221 RepID=A0A7S4BJ51_CHRCT
MSQQRARGVTLAIVCLRLYICSAAAANAGTTAAAAPDGGPAAAALLPVRAAAAEREKRMSHGKCLTSSPHPPGDEQNSPMRVVELEILTDGYAAETAWSLLQHSTDPPTVIAQVSGGLVDHTHYPYVFRIPADASAVEFTISDSAGDGFGCCGGDGDPSNDGYFVVRLDGQVMGSGVNFGSKAAVMLIGAPVASADRAHGERSLAASTVVISLRLRTDNFGEETGYVLTEDTTSSRSVIAEAAPRTLLGNTLYEREFVLDTAASDVWFTITDSEGDGLSYGTPGFYEIYVNGFFFEGRREGADQNFGFNETLIVIPLPPPPSPPSPPSMPSPPSLPLSPS